MIYLTKVYTGFKIILREHFVTLKKDAMKKLVLVVLFLSSFFCIAQVGDRVIIEGKIKVPAGDDPVGISVYNTTSNKATVTSEDGSFNIAVALEDELVFLALQFQEFTVIIDQNTLETKTLNIQIKESVTELPEVIINQTDLTGYVEVDVQRIPVEETKFPTENAAQINDADWEFRPDEQTSPENAAMRSSMMEEGMNFANIFRSIYSSRESGARDFEPLEEDVRLLYDDEFFREKLNVKQENIYEFILFAEDNGLTKEMLEEGNQLDLVQFLMEQSKRYNTIRK